MGEDLMNVSQLLMGGFKNRANPSFFAKKVGKLRDINSKKLCNLFLEPCKYQPEVALR